MAARCIRCAVVAGALVLMASSPCPAAIFFTKGVAPTLGLSGFLTYTITATSTVATDKLIGFDFVGGGGNYGVFGNFNQLNPFGLTTVFSDYAFFPFVDEDLTRDTHFLVKSTDGISITPSESTTTLKAAFNYLPAGVAAAKNQWSFLQIVTPVDGTFRATGTLTVRDPQGLDRLELVDIVSPIPEPLTISLLLLVAAICGGMIRRRS